MPSKKRTETRNTRSVTRRERGSIGRSGWSTRRASSGVTVRETRNEAKSEIEIVKVSGMNRSLIWPSRKTVGTNTMIVVIVAEKIGIATSRAASRTAFRRGVPGMFRCRLMFSSSTMESSTSRPTARAVERLAQEVHADERQQDREWDRDGDDQRRGQRAQEDEDHEEGQRRALERLVPEALDRLAD